MITASLTPPGFIAPGVPAELNVKLDAVMCFWGSCMGIAIVRRKSDKNDKHLSIVQLVEDDGCWYELGKGGHYSSTWLVEMMEVMKTALRWLNAHAKKTQYGWDET